MTRGSLRILLVLICGVGAAGNCLKSRPQSTPSGQPRLDVTPTVKNANTVSYKGVSFTFDPSLAPDVKSETIPASTEGKPSDIWPEHPGFTLPGFPRSRGQAEHGPQIRVFPLGKFREAVAIASKEYAKSVVYPPNPPDWTTYLDEEVRVLRALLAKQPNQEGLKQFLIKTRTFRDKQFDDFPQMPFLPMWEASQAFVARLKYVNFKNGRGVFFLTQWNVSDTYQVTNDGLEYAYQGIADDGQYYVYAEFSVAAPFLPRDDDPEVVAWNEKNYLLPIKSKEYQNYLRPVLAELEGLSASEFQPKLELLEQLIQSLEVKSK